MNDIWVFFISGGLFGTFAAILAVWWCEHRREHRQPQRMVMQIEHWLKHRVDN